jgi:hypothetical protein
MSNSKKNWNDSVSANEARGGPYLLSKGDSSVDLSNSKIISTSSVNPIPHPPKASLLPVKKEHFSESEGATSESDDDMYDQDYIEEQIDKLDNEIAKQERLLSAVRMKMESNMDSTDNMNADRTEEKYQFLPRIKNMATGHFIPDLGNDPSPKKQLEHNSNPPVSYSQLIESIYAANRTTALEFQARSQRQNLMMFNLSNPENQIKPHYDPSIFDYNLKINPFVRPALVSFIGSRIVARSFEQKYLYKKYKYLEDCWSENAGNLERMISEKNAPILNSTPPDIVEPSLASGRSSRRTGFRSDVVRSEAEWQTALSFLGIAPEEKTLPPQYEKFAKDVPMISKNDIMKEYKFINNNDLVVNAEKELNEFNGNLEMKWTDYDRTLFRAKLSQHGKDFFKIASFFDNKSTQDCVAYFYREKIHQRFKNLLRRSSISGRGRKRKEKVEVEVDPRGYKTFILDEFEELVYEEKPIETLETSSDENSEVEVVLTKKAKAEAMTPASSVDIMEPIDTPVEWTEDEKARATRGFELFGRDFASVASLLGTKTAAQCKNLFNSQRRQQLKEEKSTTDEPKKRNKPGPKPKKKKSDILESGGSVEAKLNVEVTDGAVETESIAPVEKKRKQKTLEPSEKKRKKIKKLGDEMDGTAGNISSEGQDPAQAIRRTGSYWSVGERQEFIRLLGSHGRNWDLISNSLESKSPIQVRNYFHNSRKKLSLDQVLEEGGHLHTSGGQNTINIVSSPMADDDGATIASNVSKLKGIDKLIRSKHISIWS